MYFFKITNCMRNETILQKMQNVSGTISKCYMINQKKYGHNFWFSIHNSFKIFSKKFRQT